MLCVQDSYSWWRFEWSEGRQCAGGGAEERAWQVVNVGCVCVGGSWGHRGKGMGEVRGWKEGGKAWFPVPQIPSSCLWSRYTKPPLKGLERGGRMKRSH